MGYAAAMEQIGGLRQEVAKLRAEMRKIQAAVEPEEVADYVFAGAAGPVRLSELFGDKDTLYVVHNMGTDCPFCTMWADGLNGLYGYLTFRAALAVVSPDPPEAQAATAARRGWRFAMASHTGTSFDKDMGYGPDEPRWPGVSVFRRRDGKILRVSDAEFGPGDDFCPVWHLLDLLPEGAEGFEVHP